MSRWTFVFVFLAAVPQLFAQPEDRFGRRDPADRPSALRLLLAAPPVTFPYLKIAAAYTGGDVSPNLNLGIKHKGDRHPWFGEVGYKYRSGASDNHNIYSGIGQYQFWTGSGNYSPLAQFNASYSNRPGSGESAGVDITGEITVRKLSVDAIAAYQWSRPDVGDRVDDFAPGISAWYEIDDNNGVGADYVFTNDVDGEDTVDVGYSRVLKHGYSVDVVWFKHNDVRVRLRKNFSPFHARSMR